MPEPALVTRLRTAGGPSFDLLVLLDRHRVLTTSQLARATATAERTVRYRLSRLQAVNLVASVRPGRETGSAPSHWWLRPAGARLVSGTAVAQDHRSPSGLHVAHAAAISEAWLALREYGPGAGIEVTAWWTDRAGWQEWDGPGGYAGRVRRLSPDAVFHADVAVAGAAAAFLEIDLASMTQTSLREKMVRYAAYATDRAWVGRHPHCPPLLLLTTTETRASTFLRAAAKFDPVTAGELLVAACGLVRDPGRAVSDPVWKLADPLAGEQTLPELLADWATEQAAAEHRRAARDAIRHREDQVWRLGQSIGHVDRWLHDPAAREALAHLTAAGPAHLLAAEPDLAARIEPAWGDSRGDGERVDMDALRNILRDRHRSLWAAHARQVLAATDRIAVDDPELAGLADQLDDGRLLAPHQLQTLTQPAIADRAQLQHDLTAAYLARRDREIQQHLARLPWRARRRADPARLAADLDAEHLLVCRTCALQYPRHDPSDRTAAEDVNVEFLGNPCPHCGRGELTGYADRDQVPTLPQRLDALRAKLTDPPTP